MSLSVVGVELMCVSSMCAILYSMDVCVHWFARRGHDNLQINDTTIYHCKKCKANLTKLWSPQLHTSDHLQEVIKDHTHKHGCVCTLIHMERM